MVVLLQYHDVCIAFCVQTVYDMLICIHAYTSYLPSAFSQSNSLKRGCLSHGFT